MRVYRINVYNHSDQVGECICEISPANGRARGAFKYSREYLSAPERYAIDPLHLPLSEDVFNVEHPGVFGVFVDSLPDDWGRKLLVRKKRLPRSEQNIPALLLALGGAGLGALMYAEDGLFPDKGEYTQSTSLERLLVESELFESGECNDDEITQLLSAGSSPGGARPKALVQSDGKHYQSHRKTPSFRAGI